ncbi:MAG: YdeI/OmpD-associated family protein [Gemella sp.]|nr:YdeI/OmpD-associated family protein [Gemella sp.]
MEETLYKKLKMESFDKKVIFKSAKENDTAFDGIELEKYKNGKVDLAIAYVYTLDEMKDTVLALSKDSILEENGVVFLLYPKNKNKLNYEAIHRDSIHPHLKISKETGYMETTEYKFNRMLALDDNYTLLAVKHIPLSKDKKKTSSSAKVADYTDKIVEVETYLQAYPKQLEFYKTLTPGYQKDWARYIYSAKTEKTITKRQEEMVDILGQGFKTKQLFREGKK